MELSKPEEHKGFAIISHLYFEYAINYSNAAMNQPMVNHNFDSRLIASILFSYFSLEAYTNEFMASNSLLTNEIKNEKPSLTERIKKIIGPNHSGNEPYNSTKILEQLRHTLVHVNPELEFTVTTNSDNTKIKGIETKIESEWSTRFLINKDAAIMEFKPITVDCTKWAMDTVFLMAHKIDKLSIKKQMKSIFKIFNTDPKCKFVSYKISSEYFRRKPNIINGSVNF